MSIDIGSFFLRHFTETDQLIFHADGHSYSLNSVRPSLCLWGTFEIEIQATENTERLNDFKPLNRFTMVTHSSASAPGGFQTLLIASKNNCRRQAKKQEKNSLLKTN